MGKTEFCNFLAKNYKNYGFTDLAYVSYGIDLFNTIQKIEFSDRAVLNYEKCRFLQLKDRSSLLLITDMPSDKSVLKEIYNQLIHLNITILLVVDSASLPNSINSCPFPAFSETTLETIFIAHTNLTLSDIRPNFHLLCAATDFHTLSLVLIAKILFANKKINFNSFMHELCTFTSISVLSDTEIVGPKTKYKGKHTTFFGHLLEELHYESYFNDSELNCLKLFSLFNGFSIDRSLLTKLIPNFTDDLMDKATNLGILIPNGDTEIRMHKIFCELIYQSNNFTNMLASNQNSRKSKKLRIRSLMDNLINIMDTCCSSPYSSSQIQDVALAFFNTMQNHPIRDISNKEQATLSQERITWIQYCHKCIVFFQKYGHTIHTSFIISKLCTEYHGLPVNPVYIFEKRFYSLTHSWQTNQLSISDALDLFTDISLYVYSLSKTESNDMIIKNISLLTDLTLDHLHIILEKIISVLKIPDVSSSLDPKYINEILGTYYCAVGLKNQLNMNVDTNIHFAKYCSSWTLSLDQTISDMTQYLNKATNLWEQLQILSDLVYLYSTKCLHHKSFMDFLILNNYYKQMISVFSASHNIPSAGIYSYCIARLYYSICHTIYDSQDLDKHFLIQELHNLPDLQKQMLQLDDPNFYYELDNSIQKVCAQLEKEIV